MDDHADEFLAASDRKRRALGKMLAEADRPSEKNHFIATNEAAWELGAFQNPPVDGMEARIRVASMAAELNSGDTLNRLAGLERDVQGALSAARETRYIAGLCAVILIAIAWRLFL